LLPQAQVLAQEDRLVCFDRKFWRHGVRGVLNHD
jgi:hypothetical protein